MSFALEVKKEIISREDFTIDSKKAILSGFIKYNGELVFSNGSIQLKLSSISNLIIRTFYSILKNLYNSNIKISIVESKILKKNKFFYLSVEDNVKDILKELDIYNINEGKKIIKISDNILMNNDMFWEYMAGVFIACGSVNDPETSNYHLELQLKDDESADYIIEILKKHNFNFKKVVKKNKTISYIKKSNDVLDFLYKISSIKCALQFEAIRTEREMKNDLNRYLNIEIHNSQLAIKAAEKQVEMINAIKDAKLFHSLSEKAQVLADIRLENPSSSFSELVILMEENDIEITKAGINYLFKKIKKVYEQLKGDNYV